MRIGLVGKPNVGKSTFYAAATLAEAEIGDYPFTTIEANRGMAYIRVPDPGGEFGVESTPRTGRIAGTDRLVPVEIIDVAGLVPGAHEGRGLGNKFLSDLARADALVHVVDASGSGDAEGNPGKLGSHDPLEDMKFLATEVDQWIGGLLSDGWTKLIRRVQQESGKIEAALAERLTGLGIDVVQCKRALHDAGLQGLPPSDWPEDARDRLAAALRAIAKPMVVALNKADLVGRDRVQELIASSDWPAVPISAQSELALGKAAQAGAIEYAPGDKDFRPVGDLSEAQKKGLDYIRHHVLEPYGSTGVHVALEAATLELLDLIPVFPVEDESRLTDKDGRVLPDCHLVPKGTTAKELAYRVHSDLGDNFVRGIDCRSKRAIGADHQLAAGDVVKIASSA